MEAYFTCFGVGWEKRIRGRLRVEFPPGRLEGEETSVRMDLNCDMGEGFGAYQAGADEALMPLVTSANIACGFHAGDPRVLDRTVALAAQHHVAVGAHPGYQDLRGFGRRPMQATPEEIEVDVLYQLGAIEAFARAHGVQLVHVKPHGALYNQAAVDAYLACAIARAIKRFNPDLVFVGLAGSAPMREAAETEGIRYAAEAFADRVYNPDGTLQSRRMAGSVITDPEKCARQALAIAKDGVAYAHTGAKVPIQAETLCLHGDNPSAVENAWAVREALSGGGIEVAPIRRRS